MTSEDRRLTGAQLAIASAALDGDAAAAYHVVREVLAEGMPLPEVLYGLLSPVLSSLGERWLGGDYLISDEHVASNAIETVVSLLAGSLEQPDEGTHVVVACVEGDSHSLPARFIAADLLYAGFRTTLLGATLPAADLREFLGEVTPNALVLTCAMAIHLTGARASIAAGHDAGVPVVVGGPAFGPTGDWATAVGADLWVPRPQDVAAALESLPQLSPRDDETAGMAAALRPLDMARLEIIAGAAATFEHDGAPRHRAELRLLYDALVASITVGDDQVLVDFARWLVSSIDGDGRGDGTALRLIEALRGAVASVVPDAAGGLEAAAASLA